MIVVAVSAHNGCQYCVAAHRAILRIRAKNPQIADEVATNFRKADITDKQRAMLEFALKVSNDSGAIDDTDFELLHGFGYDDEDIWDIAGIAAFFGLSNRLANVMALRPNDEFYALGRSGKF